MIRRLGRSDLQALVAERAAALDAAENPFATAAWIGNYLEQVARDDGVFWAADADGRALLLLQAEQHAPSQPRALNNYYASLYTPFSSAPAEGDAGRVVRDLAAARPSLATVDLSPMSESDADVAAAAFSSNGWFTRRYNCFGNWYLPCEGLSFDDFMSTRPWRRTVGTWARKERNSKTGPIIRLELISEEADLSRGMQVYSAVYAKSWKQPEPYPGFVPGWAAACAARGWLRLGIAWSGDTPVAAQFWFTVKRRAYIYKLAYDEAFSKLSAGTVLSAHMFRHALEVDRVVEIDYLTGDDPYKRNWMTHRRERVGLIACNPRTLRGALRASYEWAGAMRQRLRPRTSSATPAAAAPDQEATTT